MLSLIVKENDDTDDEDTIIFLKEMMTEHPARRTPTADVLVEALRKRGYENAVKWFWSTGGIKTDVGILSGPLNSPAILDLRALRPAARLTALGDLHPAWRAVPQAEMGIDALLTQLTTGSGS